MCCRKGLGVPYAFYMKTNRSLAIAVIFLSIFAANAFAVLRSPYPSKPYPPDRIVIIGEERHDWVRTPFPKSK
jgi:hypothetical protein